MGKPLLSILLITSVIAAALLSSCGINGKTEDFIRETVRDEIERAEKKRERELEKRRPENEIPDDAMYPAVDVYEEPATELAKPARALTGETVRVGTGEGYPGGEVIIPITIEDNESLAMVILQLEFDLENLSLLEYIFDETMLPFDEDCIIDENIVPLKIIMGDAMFEFTGSTVVKMRFSINEGAAPGVYPIRINDYDSYGENNRPRLESQFLNYNGRRIWPDFIDGCITVKR